MAEPRNTLPPNAYTKLAPGETYEPVVPATASVPEWTGRSVTMGISMAVAFSAAAAFIGLKVGQVFEAAIPISILAVGMGTTLFKRRSSILENVVVQSIGAASGLVVAGSIFTLPGLFILGLPVDLIKLFLSALLGGILGVLLLIPLRRYFVRDMHGEYPFPEATATTEVLIAGESGGQQAKVLASAAAVGGLFDFAVIHFNAFAEVFTTRSIPFLASLADKARMVFKIDVLTSVLGLGYIIGLRYTAIICAGSFVSWFVLVPLIGHFGAELTTVVPGAVGGKLIGAMSAEQIFRSYVRLIGIGGIACAGFIGILRNWRIIAGSFGLAAKGLSTKHGDTSATPRTDRDLAMKVVVLGLIGVAVLLLAFFVTGVLVDHPRVVALSLLALFVVIVITFLFTTVAAQAIATVGSNPVSGMTLMTLIIASLVLANVGLTGRDGMLAALLIGGVVCTALSTIGGFVTDLKIGYWLGATPAVQQRSKILGTLFAALTVGAVMVLLNHAYGFVETPQTPHPLTAPQANAMAAVIQAMMSSQPVPWMLYGVGAVIILIMWMLGVPALAFALGMYLPLELNTPLLIGGLVAHFVARSAKGDEKLAQARTNRGTLIASGFIAGGALMGVVAALLKGAEIWGADRGLSLPFGVNLFGNDGIPGERLAIVLYAAILAYMYWDSTRATKTA